MTFQSQFSRLHLSDFNECDFSEYVQTHLQAHRHAQDASANTPLLSAGTALAGQTQAHSGGGQHKSLLDATVERRGLGGRVIFLYLVPLLFLILIKCMLLCVNNT